MGILFTDRCPALPPGRSPPRLIVHLDLSPQHFGILSLAHGPKNLFMQQQGGVLLLAQIAAEIERRGGFGLANQIENLEIISEGQIDGLN